MAAMAMAPTTAGGAGAGAGAAGAVGAGGAAAGAGIGIGVGWPLVSLHVVRPSESARIHLVAVAASGARFYFTTLSPRVYKEARERAPGAPAAYFTREPSGIDGFEGGLGSSLTLVFIAMPPTVTAATAYRNSPYSDAGGASARDGFEPAADKAHSGLSRVYQALYAGGVMLAARDDGTSSLAGDAPLVALAHDPLLHGGPAGGAGAGAAAGDWPTGLVFHESVQEMMVTGAVAAMAEVPQCPTVLCDHIFAPSGAMLLPDDETAVAPSALGAYEVRIASDLANDVPDEKTVLELAATAEPALVERARGGGGAGTSTMVPYAAPGGKLTSFDLIAAMVTHRALNESGVPPRFHHLVRRRLWGMAPGACGSCGGGSGTCVRTEAL